MRANYDVAKAKQEWSDVDLSYLVFYHDEDGRTWKWIADKLGRTPKACINKYHYLMKDAQQRYKDDEQRDLEINGQVWGIGF